jgi:hypothetical protein
MKQLRKKAILTIMIVTLTVLLMGFANESTDKPGRQVVQLSGLIVTGDSLKPVSFATIWVKNTRRGTVSDYYGFFNIAVRELDTLRFSSVGYDEVIYIVPDTLTSIRYSVIQVMTQDTIILPETVIYPWPSREQFKRAFLMIDIPEDDYERAMKNLARAEMKERMENMGMDGGGNFRNYMNQQNQQLYYAGQIPPMRIFDPLAWAEFFKAWKDGKFRRKSD